VLDGVEKDLEPI